MQTKIMAGFRGMSVTFTVTKGRVNFTVGTISFFLANISGSDPAATIVIRDPSGDNFTYNSTISITTPASYSLPISDFLLSGSPMQYYASSTSNFRYRMTINGTNTSYLTTVYTSALTTTSVTISGFTVNFANLTPVIGSLSETTTAQAATLDICGSLLTLPQIIFTNDVAAPASCAVLFADFIPPLTIGYGSVLQVSLDGITSTIAYGGTSVSTVLSGSGTVTVGAVCFLEGSRICSMIDGIEEDRPIEQLRPGDLVKTVQHGYKAIDAIGHSKMYNPGNSRGANRLYICRKEAYPELTEDLVITGHHSILVEEITEAQEAGIKEQFGNIYITNGYYRLPACIDERAIPLEKEGLFTIWHLALDHETYTYNYGIYANGLLVESCSKRYLKELSGMTLI